MARPTPLTAEIAAALDWWREAGVDAVYADAPRGWLTEPGSEPETGPGPAAAQRAPRTSAPAPPAPAAPLIGGPRAGWPSDLAAFRAWWLAEPSLDEGGLAPRVAPAGPGAAALMVLVEMPEESDREALLSGPQGRLLDGFLEAAGLAREQVYTAAALPRHAALPDWAELARQGLGAVLAHHVALAAPRRLLVLGRSILPLCGHDPAQHSQKLRSFNHEGGTVPALFEAGLDRLLANWQLRSRLWSRWLEWTDEDRWREGSGREGPG